MDPKDPHYYRELQDIKRILSQLSKVASALEAEFDKSLSLKHRFIGNLVGGLGTALGATVVFSIVISIAITILNSLFTIELIKPMIKEIMEAIHHVNPTSHK